MRIPLRVSSVLFVITGLITMIYGYGITHEGTVLGLFPAGSGGAFFSDFALANGIGGGVGFALLIRQAQAQRHWLGWLGIALTLLGLGMSAVLTVAIFAQASYLPTNTLLLVGVSLATPTFALALIFWALDLPNTAPPFLVQKAVMGLLGLLPYFLLAFFQYGTMVTDSPRLIIIEALLRGAIWCLLGGSIWFSHDASLAVPPASFSGFFV